MTFFFFGFFLLVSFPEMDFTVKNINLLNILNLNRIL